MRKWSMKFQVIQPMAAFSRPLCIEEEFQNDTEYYRHGPGEQGESEQIAVEGGVPRYPAVTFDSKGTLWVAYIDTGSEKWKVLVEKQE